MFTRDLDLPRGPARERVWFREHTVLLRGSESRALATTGAFRVVHADDLQDSHGQAYDPRSGELRHLREQKLVRTIPIRDGREQTRDIEVETLNCRGAHAAAKAASGFSRHSAAAMRVVGSRGAGGGGSRRGSGGFAFTATTNETGCRTPDPRLAEELLR